MSTEENVKRRKWKNPLLVRIVEDELLKSNTWILKGGVELSSIPVTPGPENWTSSPKDDESTCLTYTGLFEELEYLKIETRLIGEKFVSVMGECVI
jgi:hypothetical protein